MGTNQRYSSDLSRNAIAESRLKPKPSSLSPEQIGGPVKSARRPIDVVAWVRFGEVHVELDARAIAWTAVAVQVEFTLKSGAKFQPWVWASAVRRRSNEVRQQY